MKNANIIFLILSIILCSRQNTFLQTIIINSETNGNYGNNVNNKIHNILIMGDSIAYLGNWNNYFNDIINKGINGSTCDSWVDYFDLQKNIYEYYCNIYILAVMI